MKLRTGDLYYGAALTQIADYPILSSIHRVNGKEGFYQINDDKRLLIKYASAANPSWRFTFSPDDIRAEESEKISAFDDLSLIQLIVERGASAVDSLPKGIRENKEAVAETIENNVRKLIIDEQPINPKYYEKMSELLDALIEKRKTDALAYEEYLAEIVELAKQAQNPATGASYPAMLNTAAKRALYDNLGKDEALALTLDKVTHESKQDDWRNNAMKVKKIRFAIKAVLQGDDALTDQILELVKNQREY